MRALENAIFVPTKRKRSPPTKLPCLVQSLLNLISQGRLSEALSNLDILVLRGIRLPSRTLAHLLRQCANAKYLRGGKWVHLHLKLTGFKHPTTFVANHLINMYFKCRGSEVDAREVFDKMSVRNVYSWNNMLAGYAKLGNIKQAKKLFEEMPEKDVVSWNTMVIAYAQKGSYEALSLYKEFRRLSIGYNEFSFAGVLTLCVKLKELHLTRQVHGQVLIAGLLSNLVLSSSIVDAYVKCGVMDDARRFFDNMSIRDIPAWTTMVSGYTRWGNMKLACELFIQMPEKNHVSWTALISGYARNSLGHEALELFKQMVEFRIRPDQYTFSSCLCACATISTLKHGKQIHAYLLRSNFKPNTIVVSSLIDMYSKCGCLEASIEVFYLMGNKQDGVLWNTMISALAQHGNGEEAIKMFNDMVRSGLKPDRVTYVVILSACSHSGLVQDGLKFFESMRFDHRIVPDQEHYACLIDLLGRAGHFTELIKQLKKMPCKPNDKVWNSLLGVCKMHGNMELGREAAEQLMEMEPGSSATYVQLASMYAELGRWESVAKVRKVMKERDVRKERAISLIEIENKMHSFTVSDRLHPLKEEIYLLLQQLTDHMGQPDLPLLLVGR